MERTLVSRLGGGAGLGFAGPPPGARAADVDEAGTGTGSVDDASTEDDAATVRAVAEDGIGDMLGGGLK